MCMTVIGRGHGNTMQHTLLVIHARVVVIQQDDRGVHVVIVFIEWCQSCHDHVEQHDTQVMLTGAWMQQPLDPWVWCACFLRSCHVVMLSCCRLVTDAQAAFVFIDQCPLVLLVAQSSSTWSHDASSAWLHERVSVVLLHDHDQISLAFGPVTAATRNSKHVVSHHILAPFKPWFRTLRDKQDDTQAVGMLSSRNAALAAVGVMEHVESWREGFCVDTSSSSSRVCACCFHNLHINTVKHKHKANMMLTKVW